MASDKTLYLYTLSYPFGPGEQFITPELTVLSKHFKEIHLVPERSGGEQLTELPSNVKVVELKSTGNARGLFSGMITTLQQEKGIFDFRYLLSIYRSCQIKASVLEKTITHINSNSAVHLSYWFYNWATTLAILKQKGTIKKFYSRAHGFDVYEERSPKKYIPFRRLQFQQVTKVFPVSKNGSDHLKSRFIGQAHKILSIPLGTVKVIDSPPITKDPSKKLIVSCSLLLPLKRIDLLAQAISQIRTPIHWVHFGDGPERKKIEEIISKHNNSQSIELRGNTNNLDILSFYAANQPDLFINVSEHEGLPVSIMEAISYGIPVLATNVGGTHEIVNETTGKLIPKGITAQNLKNEIGSALQWKFDRSAIVEYWGKNFSAEINAKKLAEELLAQ